MMMTCTTSAATSAVTATILLLFVLPPEAVIWAFELYEAADFCILPAVNYICVPTHQDVRKKIQYALSTLSVVGQKPILVQFWAPKKAGRTFVLTTTHQPFGVYGRDEGLAVYRIGCLQHKIFVHREEDASFGLTGLAFKTGTPQQTDNVHRAYHPEDERPPFVNEEIFSFIWGSFAVPVFLNNECLGVLEVVMTKPANSYDAEINEVCKALENAGLQSSTKTEIPKSNTKKIKSLKETEASEKIRRTTPSSKYARYKVLAPYFGISKKHAMEKVAIKFELYKEDGTISVTETTFTNALRKVGITEWPYIKNTRAEASESTSYIGTPDTVLTSWDEEGTSGCSREQTLNTITYASETQVDRPVYEPSTVAHDLSDFDLDEWINKLQWEPTQATNTSPSETYDNQPVGDGFLNFSGDEWINKLQWEPTQATNTSPTETYNNQPVGDGFFNFSGDGTHNNQLAFGTSGLNSEFDGMKHQADADIDMEMVDIDELMDLCENYNEIIQQ